MLNRAPFSRRGFFREAAAGVAGLAASDALARQSDAPPRRAAAANERLRLGVIGLRTQGTIVAKAFIKTGRADIGAVCDVDQKVLDAQAAQIESAQGKQVEKHNDFRRVLDRSDLDAVVIATPDHWHAIIAIAACQAGKDVYLEKPCAHNVAECRRIAQAAQTHGRIIQHGTMQRSGAHFQEAREYIRAGRLGKIVLVRCYSILGRAPIGHKPVAPAPPHLDYDFWLGPAPAKPYTEKRCHYNWRFMWDYGTGDMGNWGVHWLDMPLWMLDLGWPIAVSCSGGKYVHDDDKETPDTQTALYEYSNLTVLWELRMWSRFPNDGGISDSGTGVTFYGDEQVLALNRAGWKALQKDESDVLVQRHARNDSLLAHANDFIESVQSRKAPVADIASGHISAAVSLLGNVALLAGETIRYNPQTHQLDKPAHNHFLTRTYREKWTLPKG